MNGVVQNQGGKGHVPPPPPGFVQPSTHMNSFGKFVFLIIICFFFFKYASLDIKSI